MEDDDDKVRRNLVVFSALILASEFLSVQEFALLHNVLGWKETAPEPWRLTAVMILVLLYLLLRYKFSDASAKALAQTIDEWEQVKREKVALLLRCGVKLFNLSRLQLSFFITNLSKRRIDEIDEWTQPHPQAGKRVGSYVVSDRSEYKGRVSNVKFTRVSLPMDASLWEGAIHVDKVFYGERGILGGSPGGGGILYSLGAFSRLCVRLTAAIHMSLYSKSAISFFFPVVVALVSLLVLVLRLASLRQWIS